MRKEYLITIKNRRREEARRLKGVVRPSAANEILPRRLVQGELWQFFDLGTRLRTVESPSDFTNGVRELDDTTTPNIDGINTVEYVEMMFDAPASFIDQLDNVSEGLPEGETDVYALGVNHIQIEADDAAILADWDRKLLALDGDPLNPLGTTAGASGLRLPNCLPVRYGSDDQPASADTYTESEGYQNDIFDVELYKTGETRVYPNSKTRETVAEIRHWSGDESHPSDNPTLTNAVWSGMEITENTYWSSKDAPDENWNPLCLTQGEVDISKSGYIKTEEQEAARDFSVRLNSRLFYEPFDTGDTTNYKVTTAPSFTAPEVGFKAGTHTPLKFYLKPQWLAYVRLMRYQYSQPITYQTYRARAGDIYAITGADGSGDYYYNLHNAFSVDIGNPNDSNLMLFWWIPANIFGTQLEYGAADNIFNLTVNYEFTYTSETVGAVTTNTWSWSWSGTPGADNSGSTTQIITSGVITQHYDFSGINKIAADLTHAVTVPTPPWFKTGTTSGSATIAPVWGNRTATVAVTRDFLRGAHVGRFPVFPRITSAGWDSLLTYAGETDFSIDYGGGYVNIYDAEEAAEKYGRLNNWVFGNSTTYRQYAREMYARHESRDADDFWWTPDFTPKVTVFGNNTQGEVDVDGGETIQWKDVQAAGGAVWDAQMSSAVTSIVSELEAMPHIQNVSAGATTKNITERRLIYAIPLDSPAGALCAVIVKGSTKYYVWRRTPDVRGGFDFDRNQASARYSGQIDT